MSPRISIRLLAAQSDQRLAALAGEGHERAFEALVHRYRSPLLRYCRRMQLADARAEDVLQQAFLQAWMAFARGTEVRDVRPWLYRIVHNAAVNVMRRAGDGHSELTEATQAGAALVGDSELQRRMAVREALTDVAALPQMQQQAIFLTAVDGQSHDEVAGVLGISEGALRGLLYRARATLRGAAAALTPPPLLEWAARSGGAAGPTAERLGELSAGGAGAGMADLLLKGAVVAVTAGAVATGATVVNSHSHGDRPAAHRSSSAGLAGSTAERQSKVLGAPLIPASSAQVSSGDRSVRARRHARGHGRDGSGNTPRRHGDHSPLSNGRPAGSRSDGGATAGQAHGGTGASRDVSASKGSGSSPGSGSSDGEGGSAPGGNGGDRGAGSGRGSSAQPGGGQTAVTADGSSGAKDGSTSSAGQGAAATPLAPSDGSGGAQTAQDSESGSKDG
jgi:RNA polymerase sigma factor (sigma-70 family)